MKDLIITKAIKEKLAGLPSFCRLAIYDLLTYCDFSKGIISILTLDEIANQDFYVAPAAGRKKENIQGDTLRNAFRTIKKTRPNDFIFRTKNQRITIEMPFIRDLYNEYYAEIKEDAAVVAADLNSEKTLLHTVENQVSSKQVAREDVRDVAAASLFEKDINNIKTTKQKQTNKTGDKIIANDFYPKPETITLALELGLIKVTDSEEIQKFINHNQKNQTQWEDFNPVFIKWLERDRDYQTKKAQTREQKTTIYSRSSNASSSRNKNTGYTAVQEAILLNQRIIDEFNAQNGCVSSQNLFESSAYCPTLDENDTNLWGAIYA